MKNLDTASSEHNEFHPIEGVTHRTNPDTGDHILEGSESDLRQQVEELGWSVDDEVKRHLVTGAILSGAHKAIINNDGEKVGFLVDREKLVVKSSALPLA